MVVYKPLMIAAGLLGGSLASTVFSKVWKAVAHEDDAPDPTDEDRAWKEILAAVALKGAIAGVVKALIQRGGATGYRGLTGTWPA